MTLYSEPDNNPANNKNIDSILEETTNEVDKAAIETSNETAKDILRTLQWLHSDSKCFEIRILSNFGNRAGWFNDPSNAAKHIQQFIDEVYVRGNTFDGIYVTLNEPTVELMAKFNSRLERAKEGDATKDKDIVLTRHILIDLDPKRPVSGIPSTDNERELSKKKAEEVYKYLSGFNLIHPLVGMSGNGWHLVYKIIPTETSVAHPKIEKLLKLLSVKFSNETITVDAKNANPSRISKVYGPLHKKGHGNEDRQCRRSYIQHLPEPYKNSLESIQTVIDDLESGLPPETVKAVGLIKDGKFIGKNLNIDEILTKKGIDYTRNGKRYHLYQCVSNKDHGKTNDVSIFVNDDGSAVYHCHHNGCTNVTSEEIRKALDIPDPEEMTIAAVTQETDLDTSKSVDPAKLMPMKLIAHTRYANNGQALVQGLLYKGQATLLYAPDKIGKTEFVYRLLREAEHGGYCGVRVNKFRSAFISEENEEFYYNRNEDHGIDENNFYIDAHPLRNAADSKQCEALLSAIRQQCIDNNVSTIIFDTLAGCFYIKDENDTNQMKLFIYLIKSYFKDFAILLIHHNTKGKDTERGSGVIGGAVEIKATLRRLDEEGNVELVTKGKHGEMKLKYQFKNETGYQYSGINHVGLNMSKYQELKNLIGAGGKTITQMINADTSGFTRRTLHYELKLAMNEGRVIADKGETDKEARYSLAPDQPTQWIEPISSDISCNEKQGSDTVIWTKNELNDFGENE